MNNKGASHIIQIACTGKPTEKMLRKAAAILNHIALNYSMNGQKIPYNF